MLRPLLLCFLVSTTFAFYDQQQTVDPKFDYQQSSQKFLDTENQQSNVETSSYVINRGPYRYMVQRRIYVEPVAKDDQQFTQQVQSNIFGRQLENDDAQVEEYISQPAVGHGFFDSVNQDDDMQKPDARFVPVLKMSAGKMKDSSTESKESKWGKTKKDKKDKKDASIESKESYEDFSPTEKSKKKEKFDLSKSKTKEDKKKSKFDKYDKTDSKNKDVTEKPQISVVDINKQPEPVIGKLDWEKYEQDYSQKNQPGDYTLGKFNFNADSGNTYQPEQKPNTFGIYQYPQMRPMVQDVIQPQPQVPRFVNIGYDAPKPSYYGDTYQQTQYPGFTRPKYVDNTQQIQSFGQFDYTTPRQSVYDLNQKNYIVDTDMKPQQQTPVNFWSTIGKHVSDSYGTSEQYAKKIADDETPVFKPQPNNDGFWTNFGTHIASSYGAAERQAKLISDAQQRPTSFYDQQSNIYAPQYPTYIRPVPSQQFLEPSQFDLQHSIPYRPTLQLAAGSKSDSVAPVVTVPGVYWKTFGEKVKESFNKTKTMDSSSAPVSTTPIPPTFWMTYGTQIAKAFNDAKMKINAATINAKSTPASIVPVESTVAPPVIDETFWKNFGQELDAALNIPTSTPIPVTQDSQQTNLNFGMDQFEQQTNNFDQQSSNFDQQSSYDLVHSTGQNPPKLQLTAGTDGAGIATVPLYPIYPGTPGIYWKNYGDKIKEAFVPFPTGTVPISDNMVVASTPATYWWNYGKNIGKAFTDAKFNIIAATTPMTPVMVPASTQPPVLDETFWAEFGKKLNEIIRPTPPYLVPTPDTTVQQTVDNEATIQQVQDQQTSQQFYDTNIPPFHGDFQGHPNLKLEVDETPVVTVISTTPSAPGIYWKTFGEKIKESFNKTKNDGTSTNVDTDYTVEISTTPVPTTFWASFGKKIGKAFTDAKSKLISATGKAKAMIVPTTDATAGIPQSEIDDTFWESFSKQLDEAIKAKDMAEAMNKTTTESPIDIQQTVDDDTAQNLETDSQQVYQNTFNQQNIVVDDDYLTQQHQQVPQSTFDQQNVETFGQQTDDDYLTQHQQVPQSTFDQQNVETFGQQQTDDDYLTQQQTSHDMLGEHKLYLSGKADTDPTVPISGPGLYWKNYGQQIGGHYVDAKNKFVADIIKAKTPKPATELTSEEY